MWQGIQLNLSPLLTHFWPGQVRNRQLCDPTHTHTPTRACAQTHTHTHMQMHLNAQTHAMPKWAHMHGCVDTAAHCLCPADRDTSCMCVCVCVCVCVYSHFPHLAFLSCHIAIVRLPLTRLIDFLFLWFVANVTFPAGAHTLMLSTASHPGYENTGSSPGVSCMEKKCPSLPVTHSHVFQATCRLHSRCSKIIPVTSGNGDNMCTSHLHIQHQHWLELCHRLSDKSNL